MTCGSDRSIKLWRPIKGIMLKCYKAHSAEIVDCQANKDSSQFISCSTDKSVIHWDVETGKILRRFRNLAPFNSICYGQDHATALAGSIDGTLRIYDLRAVNAWEPIQTLTEASDSITCCRTFRHLVMSTSLDKCLRTYDLRNGSLTLDTLHMPLNYLSTSQNMSTLLVGCLRGNPVLLDRSHPSVLNEFKGSIIKLFKIETCFAMNDTLVASGSEDARVYVWKVDEDEPTLVLDHPIPKSERLPVIQSISTDGLDSLLSALGSTIHLWSI